MKIYFAGKVFIGPRETNDDRALVLGTVLNMSEISGESETPSIAVVCDGCGGYDGGGIAAQTVLECLAENTERILENTEELENVLDECRAAVMKKKEEMPQYAKMCTTLAGCIFKDDSTVFFHSGDSRIYRYNKWGLTKMTTDHSLVQELVSLGRMTEEEARISEHRSVITRCIGVECEAPEINIIGAPVNAGEKYLICSDGLWECVEGEKIEQILKSDMSPESMAETLVNLAMACSTDDNVSVCICAVEGEETAINDEPFVL